MGASLTSSLWGHRSHHAPSTTITNPSTTTAQANNKRKMSSSPPPENRHGHCDDNSSLSPPPLTGGDAATAAALVTPSAYATKSSLVTFLSRDIRPKEGHRLLLPSLTTKDRLHLSECCHELGPYRFDLWRMRLRPHPSPSAAMEGLRNLVEGHEGGGGGLDYLWVEDRSLIHVLDLDRWKGLKTLHLPDAGLMDEDVEYVERALVEGRLANLEELNLSWNSSLGGSGVRRVIGALGQGACRQLLRLGLGNTIRVVDSDPISIGHAVGKALESGRLHHLQDLDLSFNKLGQGGGVAVARALQGGACPQLVMLNMWMCRLTAADGEALGAAMRAGGCAKLEELMVDGMGGMGDEGFGAIFESLAAGSCPNLKRLFLISSRMDLPAAAALGHALQSGNCPHLKGLYLGLAFKEPGACLLVLQAIIDQAELGSMANLLYLGLESTHLGQEHGRVLGEAIGNGALPKLQVLSVSANSALGDAGVLPIMAGLEGRGCPHLEELMVSEVGMGPQGTQALSRALASGKLSRLQTLDFHTNAGTGDEAIKEVTYGLKQCQELREMLVEETGMGREAGRALVQALQAGAWPRLVWMDAGGNDHVFVDEELGMGLAEVMEGEGRFANLVRLSVDKTGLSKAVVGRILGVVERGACPRLREVTLDECNVDEGWVERLKSRGVHVNRKS